MAKDWKYGENNNNIILSESPKQKLRITGHRIASVLGLNQYQSEFGAWAEITKLVKLPFEDTEPPTTNPLVRMWVKNGL